ncbi:carboxypeptidase-like regulatory domain-containing protein [Vampirovibrio sp.]|uniref:carboxypeptidase-like regulatory domain-containing protein n=1 Tax=Vampirovibrio sp. TaxID=2717857 RepID=UPI0035935487
MQKGRIVCTLFLCLLLLLKGFYLPAFAQFGVGVGAWNWGGFGSWFGVFVQPVCRRCLFNKPNRIDTAPQANGHLAGVITLRSVCPTPTPNVACPLLPQALNETTLSAKPYGGNQWMTSRPDASGRYRLALPPGGYQLSIHHPLWGESDQVLRQIIIQPGQTNTQNFQIELPLQQ